MVKETEVFSNVELSSRERFSVVNSLFVIMHISMTVVIYFFNIVVIFFILFNKTISRPMKKYIFNLYQFGNS